MLKRIALLSILPALSFAQTLTNAIQGVGPEGGIKPYICTKDNVSIAPGETKEVGQKDYVGAALRWNGCSQRDGYLGWVDILLGKNNTIQSYSPPEGVHISYAHRGIDAKGQITGNIVYTPIQTNSSLNSALPARNFAFAGINLSGLEFGKVIDPTVVPNLSAEDTLSPYSDLKATQAFLDSGMNTVRLPISWGYLQLEGAGIGNINLNYYDNYIKPLLQSLTKAKVHTIIDLHAYMRYSKFGKEYSGCFGNAPCPDGTLILDAKAYESVWGQLVKHIQEDPEINQDYILLDLVNEPVEVPDDKVFTIQAQLINFLRAQNFKGTILVEGNHWTGLHSWNKEWTGSDGKKYSNASLFTRKHFIDAGITDLSKILINVHQYFDSNYSGTEDSCQQDLSTTGMDGFNLETFADYLKTNQLKAIVTEFGVGKDQASCSSALNQFMRYLESHNAKDKDYGFAGFTLWSSGHGWGDYNLRIKPDSYPMQVMEDYL